MRYLLGAFLVMALMTGLVSADTMVLNPGTGNLRTLSPGTAGMQFTVASSFNLTVTALGFYDNGGDGFNNSHKVGLWTGAGDPNKTGGILLAEVSLNSGTSGTLIGGYRYLNLPTPVQLISGETYTLGGQTTGTDLFRDSNGSATFGPEFGNLIGRWIQEGSAGYSKPTNTGAATGYMAPNMLYSVPEPGVIAPLGLAGLFTLRRRRRVAKRAVRLTTHPAV